VHEDKLSHDERVRLECLAQANVTAAAGAARVGGPVPGQLVLNLAGSYERFVRDGHTER
jgi:hypothetical protein